ncbi:MAG: inositol monophosphatase [Actinomycetota bacterium]|nr:inositol monophosphatase [Actinomycetota bacterium]
MSAPDELRLAERAARAAGEVLLEHYGGPGSEVGHKSSQTDPVSAADHDAEAAVVGLLRSERPDDEVLAEEGSGGGEGKSGRRWIVDPLDGTVNFLYGYPAWCVSIACEDEHGSLVAVVHDPVRGETFSAARDAGAELNGEPVRVRDEHSLESALLATGFGYDSDRRAAQAETARQVLPRARDIRRGGSAALDLAWLAAGRLDGYWEAGLNPWDWAAGRLLVTEAGGAIEEWREQLAGEEVQSIAAANPALLPRIVELVR